MTNVRAMDGPYAAIPTELRTMNQWVAWWSVVGTGKPVKLPNGKFTREPLKKQDKPHKLPLNPHTGGLAATTWPATWGSFDQALAAVRKWSLSGIGYVFTGTDPYSGVRWDNCRNPDTGEIAEWAWKITRGLNSYTEVSPSETGVHITHEVNSLPVKATRLSTTVERWRCSRERDISLSPAPMSIALRQKY